jgi:hypothetical protein
MVIRQLNLSRTRMDSRVTPSPESMTTPVNVRSATLENVHDAASASTAWTAMYLDDTFSRRVPQAAEDLTHGGTM